MEFSHWTIFNVAVIQNQNWGAQQRSANQGSNLRFVVETNFDTLFPMLSWKQIFNVQIWVDISLTSSQTTI